MTVNLCHGWHSSVQLDSKYVGSRLALHLQLDDMRVSKQLQVLNLALDSACHVAANELLPGYDLQGHLLASTSVDGQLDLSEGALAQSLDDIVLADAVIALDLVGHGRACGGGGGGARHVMSDGVPAVVLDDDVGCSKCGGGVCDVDPASAHLGGTEGDGQLAAVFVVGGGTWRSHDGRGGVERGLRFWMWGARNR